MEGRWKPSFGDIEVHDMLRLRGPSDILAELKDEDGRIMPLCQVGYFNFGDNLAVNFEHLFKTGYAFDGIEKLIEKDAPAGSPPDGMPVDVVRM